MNPEKKLIRICRELLEEKLHLPQNGLWKQRDFEYLAGLISETTGNRISISTLKRIWKEDDRVPQVYTLNALVSLLGYESWTDFRQDYIQQAVSVPSFHERQRKKIKISIPFYLVLAVIILAAAIFILYPGMSGRSSNKSDVVFKTKKNLPSGVPNTVVFEYDISKIDFDSAFIQQSWDERMRARVNKNNHFQTFIYYYPGYHTAKLIIDDKIVKKEFVNITTQGWEALVDGSSDKVPGYLPKDSIIHDGSLFAAKEMLLHNNIHVDWNDFFINYFNVGKFSGADASNFTFETRLKNALKEGGLVCQYTQVTLICENGMISIPFCNPGCAANIHLHVSDVFMEGKKNDLSAFGIDLSDWRNIKIKTVENKLAVYSDEKNIYNLRFTKDLGKITGLHYKFYGCGAVDKVKLYDSKNELRYSDEF